MSGYWRDPATGARLGEEAAVARLTAVRVLLLGDRHDRVEDHRWQERMVAAMAAARGEVAVGLEMFPRRAQPVLDAWVAGALGEAEFLAQVRWREVWGFDPELYLPVFRRCRALGLPMKALNLDRPLVSRIGREGWGALPEEERAWLSPAVPATPAYRRYLFEATGGVRPGRQAQSPEDPAFDRFVRAQQAWDRAFACAIAAALAEAPGRPMAALIGRGHLEFGHGTPAQLADLGVDGVVVALPADPEDPGESGIADITFVRGPGPIANH